MTSIDTSMNCASCGKEGGNINTCNKCKMVKYCNAACKKKHRTKHMKSCKKRVAELHDEALFKEHPPPEECPICFLPLPISCNETNFYSCCGKRICSGCTYAMDEEARGREKIGLCPFCRTPSPTSQEEVKRIKKLMEADNAYAFYVLASYYDRGIKGVPQDYEKANELYLRAGELGHAASYYNLGISYDFHGNGVEVDKKKAKHYYELAAMNGDMNARHNLGCMEGQAGNEHRAYKHYIIAAKSGYKISLDQVKEGFMDGIVSKGEYANALRAYQSRQDLIKSVMRDRARAARE